jgi:hypothetical protein
MQVPAASSAATGGVVSATAAAAVVTPVPTIPDAPPGYAVMYVLLALLVEDFQQAVLPVIVASFANFTGCPVANVTAEVAAGSIVIRIVAPSEYVALATNAIKSQKLAVLGGIPVVGVSNIVGPMEFISQCYTSGSFGYCANSSVPSLPHST